MNAITPTEPDEQPALGDFWDARYAESEQIWSGRPNVALVRELAGTEPGRALDLGCGEGADAIWLAGRGWHVTAADVSRVALARAAEHAAAASPPVDGRIDWQQHDLGVSFPYDSYDLVSAQFLPSPGGIPREEILRRAAAAVAPGGILLIEGHSGLPAWEHRHGHDEHLPSPDEVLAGLRLADGAWEILRAEEHERVQTGPDGTELGTRTDSTVKLRRLHP